jgi:hypothetical protein
MILPRARVDGRFCASRLADAVDLVELLVRSPSHAVLQVPLSGRLAGSTLDLRSRGSASRAFWLFRVPPGSGNDPAWMK